MEEDVPLREYLLVLIHKWYLVVGTLLLVLAIAVVLPYLRPQVFEARTKLLIVAPLSERVLGQGGDTQNVAGANLSLGTLSVLATSNDLLEKIIAELDLRDPTTGRPWAPERLAHMMNPTVETASQGGSQTTIPLLAMTVQGSDPGLLKRIADAWAEAFIQENSELFKTEAARSYEFLNGRYEDSKNALEEKQAEKLSYQQKNPQDALQSQLSVLKSRYEDFLNQLESERTALVGYQAQLKSAEEAIASEPQFLTLERSISNDAIWALLANNPSQQTEEVLPQLTITDQERNDLYFSLKNQIVFLKSQVATSGTRVSYLESKTAEFKDSVEQLSSRIAAIQLDTSRFDQDIQVLTNNLTPLAQRVMEAQIASAEQSSSIRVVESAVEPQTPVNSERPLSLPLAGALGLFLGVGLAMFVHYLQGPQIVVQDQSHNEE